MITAGTPGAALSGWDDRDPFTAAPTGTATATATAATSSPKQPFYKKRWFIISQIILIPLSIALLFILLFPVVRAIIALVVKRTNLDVQAAVITQPVNNSYVFLPLSLPFALFVLTDSKIASVYTSKAMYVFLLEPT